MLHKVLINKYKSKLLNDLYNSFSDASIQAMENILDTFEFEEDEDIEEIAWTETNNYFIYDCDAVEYLLDQIGGDWSEAIFEGCDQASTIAGYYLNQEVQQIINELEDYTNEIVNR